MLKSREEIVDAGFITREFSCSHLFFHACAFGSDPLVVKQRARRVELPLESIG